MKNTFFMMLVAIPITLFCMHDDKKLTEKRSQPRRYKIEKQQMIQDISEEQCSPDDQTLISVVNWAIAEYPSEHSHDITIWQWPTLPSWNPNSIALEDVADNYDTEKIS